MSIQNRETQAGLRYVGRYRGPDKTERSRRLERRKDAKGWIEGLACSADRRWRIVDEIRDTRGMRASVKRAQPSVEGLRLPLLAAG